MITLSQGLAGLCLALLVATSVQTCRLERVKGSQAIAERNYSEQIRKLEKSKKDAVAEVDTLRTEEKEKAKEEYENTIADLRAGNLQLRKRFTCPKTPSGTTGIAGVGDAEEGSGLSTDDAEFLISEAERADEVVRQLQAAQDLLRILTEDQK